MEKYGNWNYFAGETQHQIWISRKKNPQTLKEVDWDYPIWGTTEPQNTCADRIKGGNR